MNSSTKKQILESINNPVTFEPIARDSFDSADKNKNGKIEKNELFECMKEVANGLNLPAPTKKALEEMFKKLDVDKNGYIDFNEFKVFAKDNMINLINNMQIKKEKIFKNFQF